jgi:hypothetical protein
MNPGRLLLLLGLLSATTATQAQPRDRDHERSRERERERGPRVIVYQDAEYRGDSLVLYPGDSLENLSGLTFANGGRLNDRVSSIRVEGGAEVYVHADARFRGAVMRLTEHARDLTGRDETQADPDTVIKRAYLDLLGREPDPAGFRDYRSLIIDQGWNEIMVRDNIRRGDEFRREGADRIIRRAYLDVLGREVDAEGLKHFRHNLLEKNWTEGDVRDALRRSDEFRKKTGGR